MRQRKKKKQSRQTKQSIPVSVSIHATINNSTETGTDSRSSRRSRPRSGCECCDGGTCCWLVCVIYLLVRGGFGAGEFTPMRGVGREMDSGRCCLSDAIVRAYRYGLALDTPPSSWVPCRHGPWAARQKWIWADVHVPSFVG